MYRYRRTLAIIILVALFSLVLANIITVLN